MTRLPSNAGSNAQMQQEQPGEEQAAAGALVPATPKEHQEKQDEDVVCNPFGLLHNGRFGNRHDLIFSTLRRESLPQEETHSREFMQRRGRLTSATLSVDTANSAPSANHQLLTCHQKPRLLAHNFQKRTEEEQRIKHAKPGLHSSRNRSNRSHDLR